MTQVHFTLKSEELQIHFDIWVPLNRQIPMKQNHVLVLRQNRQYHSFDRCTPMNRYQQTFVRKHGIRIVFLTLKQCSYIFLFELGL